MAPDEPVASTDAAGGRGPRDPDPTAPGPASRAAPPTGSPRPCPPRNGDYTYGYINEV